MGTAAHLKVWGGDPAGLAESAAELARLERLWSRFLPDSDTSRLNSAGGRWVDVAPETAELVRAAVRLSVETGGAFDATLGSGGGRRPEVLGRSVRLPAGARLDFGGIGKGAAVQRVCGLLAAAGAQAALVDFGQSSVGVVGLPPGRDRWRVAVRRPSGLPTARPLVLDLERGYLSSSGDEGPRVPGASGRPTLDPRTGEPPAAGLRAVTVVAGDAVRAEALSTALLVLGLEEGRALHEARGGFEAVWIDDAGEVHATRGLRR